MEENGESMSGLKRMLWPVNLTLHQTAWPIQVIQGISSKETRKDGILVWLCGYLLSYKMSTSLLLVLSSSFSVPNIFLSKNCQEPNHLVKDRYIIKVSSEFWLKSRER